MLTLWHAAMTVLLSKLGFFVTRSNIKAFRRPDSFIIDVEPQDIVTSWAALQQGLSSIKRYWKANQHTTMASKSQCPNRHIMRYSPLKWIALIAFRTIKIRRQQTTHGGYCNAVTVAVTDQIAHLLTSSVKMNTMLFYRHDAVCDNVIKKNNKIPNIGLTICLPPY